MTPYANRGGDSGIIGYEYDDDSITVFFGDGSRYLYTNDSAGVQSIIQMKTLADSGEGLNEFINRHVKKKYAQKLTGKSF